MKNIKHIIALTVVVLQLGAQTKNKILLINGIDHIGNGTVIENSYIGIADGKINLVADSKT